MALRGADVRAIGHIPHRVCVLSGPNLAKEIMGRGAYRLRGCGSYPAGG